MFPCPSKECWTFDSKTGHCNLIHDANPKCTSVACGAETMTVAFTKSVFGSSYGVSDITPTPVANGDDSGFQLECGLGKCQMAHSIENNK